MRLTYDQISESEQSDSFNSIHEVIEFAITKLNGNYTLDMTESQLISELNKNGYYLN